MSDLKRRLRQLERRAAEAIHAGGLLPVDDIVRYLQWHDKGKPGRDERVPLATWRRLEEKQLERIGRNE